MSNDSQPSPVKAQAIFDDIVSSVTALLQQSGRTDFRVTVDENAGREATISIWLAKSDVAQFVAINELCLIEANQGNFQWHLDVDIRYVVFGEVQSEEQPYPFAPQTMHVYMIKAIAEAIRAGLSSSGQRPWVYVTDYAANNVTLNPQGKVEVFGIPSEVIFAEGLPTRVILELKS